MNEIKEAIWWFENSICDDDPMHTDDNCPDCKNNRVALRVLRAQLERESDSEHLREINGEWLFDDFRGVISYDCSVCDAQVRHKYNYCPKCGTKMKGGGLLWQDT